MKPPSGGPRTSAVSPGKVIKAIAWVSRSLGVLRNTIKRPTGTIMAPPAPRTIRISVHCVRVCATPYSNDESVNVAMAAAKIARSITVRNPAADRNKYSNREQVRRRAYVETDSAHMKALGHLRKRRGDDGAIHFV